MSADGKGPVTAGRGLLVVIAGPSGVGKGTVLSRVLDRVADAEISVSATTREPRSGEVDGREYHFLDRDQFVSDARDGGFLEWAEYAGNYYGTPATTVRQRLADGAVVCLEIEVQGAVQVRELDPDALLVFLAPPSRDELERRLRSRGTEDEAAILERMTEADRELAAADQFDLVVVNDDVTRASERIIQAIAATQDRRC